MLIYYVIYSGSVLVVCSERALPDLYAWAKMEGTRKVTPDVTAAAD